MERTTKEKLNDGNNNSATYSYLANSPLMSQIAFKQSSTTRMTTSKPYDHLNRLSSMSSQPSGMGVPPLSFNYNYNSANQRTQDKLADGSYWVYQYDSLGQVSSGCKYFYDGTPVPGQQFGYGFDTIGNRTQTKAGGDQTGGNQRLANYSVNSLNQITGRDYPGTNDVIGVALATNAVTVNSQAAFHKWEYFRGTVQTNNLSSAQWLPVTVASGGHTSTGSIYMPETPEYFSYDADGNLTNDGRWAYTWDAENRLIGMTVNTNVGPQLQLSFVYDSKGRRIQKLVFSNSVALYTNDFLYDGWNLVGELNPNNTLLRGYVWGVDLSGSLQGAGGVGGLLEVSYYGSSTTNCFAAFDGNGNIAGLVNGWDGTLLANYEYGPFGEVVRSTGPMAKVNPIRFSTKYQDDESDFLYYGYRYYKPSTGTWLSRDPAGEKGGVDLYEFIKDSPLNYSDALGLSCSGGCGPDVTAAVQKVLEQEENDFSSSTVPDSTKCTACQNLYNPQTAGADWDIFYLAGIGLDKNNKGCQRTVYYHGKCVWASALNYILFGKANALCNAKFSSQPYWVYGVPITWTQFDMNLAIEWHKFGPGGDWPWNPEALAAFDFAQQGYTGSNVSLFTDGPGCDTTTVQPYARNLGWHWDAFYENGN